MSSSNGNNDGYTECGYRTYSFSYSPSSFGTLVTDSDQETFAIEAYYPDFSAQTYTVTVTVELQMDTSINRQYTFDVTVQPNPCESTAFEWKSLVD